MKKTFIILFVLLSLFSFSQEKKFVKSGYITFNSNSILEFKNLTIENGAATYFNEVSQTETSYPLNSIKKIIDGSGVVVYEPQKMPMVTKVPNEMAKNTVVVSSKKEEEKLVYKSSTRIYSKGEKLSNQELEVLLKPSPEIYDKYKRGKSSASLGSILIGGGIGLFVGGAFINLSSTNGGSPALLIVGLAATGVGIPVTLGGTKNIKKAVKEFNSLPVRPVSYFDKSELKVIANGNGVGFQLQF